MSENRMPSLSAVVSVGEHEVWADYGGDPATATGPGPHGQWRVAKVSGPKDSAKYYARLFASAPDLLAALERFVSLCPSAEGLGGHAPMVAFDTAAHAARAAIAKARGKA